MRAAQATLMWIREQEWHKQCPRIGTWGPSYLGLTQWALYGTSHTTFERLSPRPQTYVFIALCSLRFTDSADAEIPPPDVMCPVVTCTRFKDIVAPDDNSFLLSLFTR